MEGADLTLIQGLLGLCAKSIAIDIINQAQATVTKVNDLKKITEARNLVNTGDASLRSCEYGKAVAIYQECLRKILGLS